MFDRLKSLLRAPEAKASRTARVIAFDGGGRVRWTPRDYAALTREGFAKNAIVYRAVRLVAESVGALSFVLYEGAAELTAHPLLDLMARPNPRQDGPSFLESIAAYLLLAGNAYVEAVSLAGDRAQAAAAASARALRAAARPHEGGARAGRLAASLRLYRQRGERTLRPGRRDPAADPASDAV